jgi:hypothetical protein
MRSVEAGVRSRARSTAACMACVFAAMPSALRLRVTPSSALKMARADAVRFSICDDDAASDRSRTGAKVATRAPSSASKRVSSRSASAAASRTTVLGAGARPAIVGTTADW